MKARGWDQGRQLSEKQRSLLAKQGINPDRVSFAEGRQLIAEIFRRWDGKLCSFKQAKVLRKYGYDAEVSFAEASATLMGWPATAGAGGGAGGEPARREGNPAWN